MSFTITALSGTPVDVAKKIGAYFDPKDTKKRSGTKYSHAGSRTGLASMMDGPLIQKNFERQKN